MSGPIYNFVRLFVATLYPSYASFKAVKTKNVKEYVKWMMYWIIFSMFSSLETVLDPFVSFWLPFYCEVKLVLLLYLVAPATRGSSVIYRRWVHPMLCNKEEDIDNVLGRIKEQGYNTVVSWIQKGVKYVGGLMVTTAIKGGGGLITQLKKSYSLTDLSDQNKNKGGSRFTDITEEEGSFSPYGTPIQKRKLYSSQNDLRVNAGFRSNQLMFQSPTRLLSSESISSGYNTDFHPVTGQTMNTGDYELWDRGEQVAQRHQSHHNLDAMGRNINQGRYETQSNFSDVHHRGGKTRIRMKQRTTNMERSSVSEDEKEPFHESLPKPFGQPHGGGNPDKMFMSPSSSCYPSDRESLVDSGSDTDCDNDIFSDATLEDPDESFRRNIYNDVYPSHTKNQSVPLSKEDIYEPYQERQQLPPRRSARIAGIVKDSGSYYSTM